MDEAITGSELTRAMLENGHEEIWCAVDDSCDQEAMSNLANNDFTAYIVSFEDGMFYCTSGMAWLCAVPIKIVGITQTEAKLQNISKHKLNCC
ncbi:hypothetical protein [Psychrobacter sp. ANT_WB68]|uniref:hypothetical protein n=1 Tax=Psychrobacter sp. ANT_WB68 TaxID=2597355 RepID=UPI0011F3FBF5|nr:hypothetical protein [Psychrobacter sp. ANT_WB68]KAA0915665.1 hypothetical protein FQ084_03730 [Psychrobacter sp. ANT_WB68]